MNKTKYIKGILEEDIYNLAREVRNKTLRSDEWYRNGELEDMVELLVERILNKIEDDI